jgi:choline-sulfatase
MHFCGPDQLHGFEERLTTDIYPADYGWTPDWDRPHERPSWYHDMSSVIDAGPCLRSNQLDFDDEVAFAAGRSLFGHIRSGDERPFCYVVSFSHPHDPFTISRQWWDLYRDEDIPLPAGGAGPLEAALHAHERRLREVCAMSGAEITQDHVRAARRAYYGAISYVDDHTSRLTGLLRDTGRLDDTVVIVTSDHGEMLGERGAWYKMSFFEGAARVPLIVRAPRCPRWTCCRPWSAWPTTVTCPASSGLLTAGACCRTSRAPPTATRWWRNTSPRGRSRRSS